MAKKSNWMTGIRLFYENDITVIPPTDYMQG